MVRTIEQPLVQRPSSPLGEADLAFEALALETGRLTFQLPGTTMREKLLQNIAQDAVRSQSGLAFRPHVTAAQMHDVPPAHLVALLRFIAPFAGYPAAADAVDALAGVVEVDESAAEATAEATAEKLNGPGSGQSVPRALLADVADPWLSELMVSRLTQAWAESALSQREKVIVALTVAVVGAAEEHTLAGCVRAGLEVGVPSSALLDAVRYCPELRPDRASAASRLTSELLEPQGSVLGTTAGEDR